MILGDGILRRQFNNSWYCTRDDENIFSDDLKIGPNSIDVTLSRDFYIPISGEESHVDPSNSYSINHEHLVLDRVVMNPGDFLIAKTREAFNVDDPIDLLKIGIPFYAVQMYHGRSTLGRLGIFTDCGAAFGDYGYKSKWTLELKNVSNEPVLLTAGMRIGQVSFEASVGVESLYDGAYSGEVSSAYPILGKGRF